MTTQCHLLATAIESTFFVCRIPAHRLVLSASSPYFAAMFTGCLRESKEEEVRLGEVQGDVLSVLVHFCYTGQVELREEIVETLLATACLLQLNTVVTACCNFLIRQLHPSNCLGFTFFAEQQSCTALLQLAKAYTCTHFMQVRRSPLSRAYSALIPTPPLFLSLARCARTRNSSS